MGTTSRHEKFHWCRNGLGHLTVDPVTTLEMAPDPALIFWVRRDLIREPVGPVEELWRLPEPLRILKQQQSNGAWRFAGKTPAFFNHDLLETFRQLRVLVMQYGVDRSHPAMAAAAEYVFSCQTPEGDLRGIIGNQYMPYYHGVILELLIRAGYRDDPRVMNGLAWLLSMRQDDGGWIVPAQAVPAKSKNAGLWAGEPVPPDRSLPHSHLATGMALRALVAHPHFRARDEVKLAGTRLKARLLRPDKYNDRRAARYWTKFQYPFWWTELIMALDSLAKIGFTAADDDIRRGLDWLITHQDDDGLWSTGYDKGPRAALMRGWVGLAACRVLIHYFGEHG